MSVITENNKSHTYPAKSYQACDAMTQSSSPLKVGFQGYVQLLEQEQTKITV